MVSFLFKNWIRCVLTMVALGVAAMAIQQAISWRHRVARAPTQETPAPSDSAAEAELPQVEVPVAVTPKESSLVLGGTNVVAPVSAFAQETVVVPMVPGQTIAPPLARALPAGPGAPLVGIGSPRNSETATLNPPLAFTVDPKNLTPEQQTALARIQDRFLKAIGDANQDPADPAYSQRWMTAQEIADQSYKAFFGWTAFSQMQLERARNSYTEIQVP